MAQIELPNGKMLNYQVRESKRSKRLRLQLDARKGLTAIVPIGTSSKKIESVIVQKSNWIQKHLDNFSKLELPDAQPKLVRPKSIDLTVLNEEWKIEYKAESSNKLMLQVQGDKQLLLYGAIDNISACHNLLRRWLATHAYLALFPQLDAISKEANLTFKKLTIRNQKTRWGSCSSQSNISLNCKLLFLSREEVRYVLIHELCHTVEMNHSTKFWRLVKQFEPNVDEIHKIMKNAWERIPHWAHA